MLLGLLSCALCEQKSIVFFHSKLVVRPQEDALLKMPLRSVAMSLITVTCEKRNSVFDSTPESARSSLITVCKQHESVLSHDVVPANSNLFMDVFNFASDHT